MDPRHAVLAAAMLFAATSAAVAGESTRYGQPGYWRCQNMQSSPTETLYVSDIFELQTEPEEVQNAFQQELAKKYAVKSRVGCSMAYIGAGILEKLKADDLRWFQQIRSGGGKVVATHWTYVAAATKFSYLCFGGATVAEGPAQRKNYFLYTDPIELAGGMEARLSEDWIAHLAELHPGWFFAAYQGCIRLPADPAAWPGVLASYVDIWKERNAEIAKLDWNYTPAAAKAPASSTGAATTVAAGTLYQCVYYDVGAVGRGNYMTRAFESAKSRWDIIAAWNAHMRAAHPPMTFAQVDCNGTTAKAAAAALAQGTIQPVNWKY